MKIGIFSDTFYPEINGVATSCHILHRELTAMGHEVHVFAPKCKGWEEHASDTIHYLKSVPLPVLKDRNVGIPGKGIIHAADDIGFDIVHTHSEFAMGMLGLHVAKAAGCALVHTYHTIWENYTYYMTHGFADKTAQKLARKYSGWWCEKFSRVIAPTEKTSGLLRKYGVTSPIDIIPSGIDLGRFDPKNHSPEEIAEIRRECGVPEGKRVLINIGRISKEKNIEKVVRVFPRLLLHCPDVHLVIVGEGPMLNTLRDMVKVLDIEEHVSITGSKQWEIIDRYYAIGDVFVSASHSETQGLTYIEAMSSGLCVCAVNDPCLENVVIDGVSGVLSGDEDEELLGALVRAFGDEGRRIKESSVEHARPFSAEYFAKSVEKCYERAVADKL